MRAGGIKEIRLPQKAQEYIKSQGNVSSCLFVFFVAILSAHLETALQRRPRVSIYHARKTSGAPFDGRCLRSESQRLDACSVAPTSLGDRRLLFLGNGTKSECGNIWIRHSLALCEDSKGLRIQAKYFQQHKCIA